MKIKEETLNKIEQDRKIQYFRYDYLLHISGKFVFSHILLFFLFLILAAKFSPCIVLLTIPCIISWNYFILFDKKRLIYKDIYKPQRYEYIGALFQTITVGVFICYAIWKTYERMF